MNNITHAPQDAPISDDARRSILEGAGLFARDPSDLPSHWEGVQATWPSL